MVIRIYFLKKRQHSLCTVRRERQYLRDQVLPRHVLEYKKECLSNVADASVAVVYPGQSGHNADKVCARSHRAGDEYGIHSQEVPAVPLCFISGNEGIGRRLNLAG